MLMPLSSLRLLACVLPLLMLCFARLHATKTLDEVLEKSELRNVYVHFKITDTDLESVRCTLDGIEACITLDTYFKAMKDDSAYSTIPTGYYPSRSLNRLEFAQILHALNHRSVITLSSVADIIDTFMYTLEKTKYFTHALKTHVLLDDSTTTMIDIFNYIRRILAISIDECRWWLIDLHERAAKTDASHRRKIPPSYLLLRPPLSSIR